MSSFQSSSAKMPFHSNALWVTMTACMVANTVIATSSDDCQTTTGRCHILSNGSSMLQIAGRVQSTSMALFSRDEDCQPSKGSCQHLSHGSSMLQVAGRVTSTSFALSSGQDVEVSILFEEKECKESAENLGYSFDTVEDCANTALQMCQSDTIMYPKRSLVSKWGCRCCKEGMAEGGKSNSNWDVYKIAEVTPTFEAKMLFPHSECKSQAMHLGNTFDTVDACAQAAALETRCSATIMYPDGEKWSKWGCRCCEAGMAEGGKSHKNWNVYEIHLKEATSAPTPMPPPKWEPRRRRNLPWPSEDTERCAQTNKQKSMYGEFEFQPPLSVKGSTHLSMSVIWEDVVKAPWRQLHVNVYAAWVFKTHKDGVKGPGGYFGAQLLSKSAFIFSVWDGNRFTGHGHSKDIVKSDQLVWPLTSVCKRNCQDCGLHHLRKFRSAGVTTGTKCMVDYPAMNELGRFDLSIQRLDASFTINTAEYGGMPSGHETMLEEGDRIVTGSRWQVTARDAQTGKEVEVATLLFEGADEINRITTFDEMIGCHKCNDAYHRDTRLGPFLHDADGSVRAPISAYRKLNGPTTCTKYQVTGSKEESSITFQGGPGAIANFEPGAFSTLW